jgi:hypothetical protein
MTCIAGIIDVDGSIWMGCDSVNCGSYQRIYKDPKIFIRKSKNGTPWIIGAAGNSRIKDILGHLLPPLPNMQRSTLRQKMVTEFIPTIQKLLDEHGQVAKKEGLETMDGILLLGHIGHLYTVSPNFAAIEQQEKYAAVGSGESEALGSLFTTKELGIEDPRKRLLYALQAAEKFRDTVRRPFRIMKIKNPHH